MITFGPNTGFMISAATGDVHDVAFRQLLRSIDVKFYLSVISRIVAAPPMAPANGDRYIVPAGASGAWAGQTNKIAAWTTDNPASPGGLWEFYTAKDGWVCWSAADATFYFVAAGAWVQLGSALTSTILALIATCEKIVNKGAANGYASLDVTGHVPIAQIPAAAIGGLNYRGTWDATANSPALASGAGANGDFYKVSVAGTTALDGNADWHVGDVLIFDGTHWEQVNNYEAVTSVAGRTGAVVIAEADVAGLVADLATNTAAVAAEATARAAAVAVEAARALAAEALAEQTANKGVASGYASLDSGGQVPAAQSRVMSVAGRTGTVVIAESDVGTLVADLAATEKTANKGAASGYASLDGTGHIPIAQIPAGLAGALQYQGTWDASANSPALVGGVGTKGFFYKVSVAGTTLIDTNNVWHLGDLIIFDGTVWDKVDNYEAVLSVAGRSGAIVLAEADVTGLVADLATNAAAVVTETTRATAAEALLAPKASPALTGSPTAPTQAALDNSTKLGTTAYADTAVGVITAYGPPPSATVGDEGFFAPFGILYLPLGSVDSTFGNQFRATDTNVVWVMKFTLFKACVVGHLVVQVTQLLAGTLFDVGLYNAAKNLLCHMGATAGTSLGNKSASFAQVTLPAGTYYLAWTANLAAGSLSPLSLKEASGTAQLSTGLTTLLINVNGVRYGTAANASVAGVLPATLGALTANNSTTTYPPIVFCEP